MFPDSAELDQSGGGGGVGGRKARRSAGVSGAGRARAAVSDLSPSKARLILPTSSGPVTCMKRKVFFS